MTAIKDLDTISERGKRTVYQGLKTSEREKVAFFICLWKDCSLAKDFIKKTSYDNGISVQLNTPQPLPSLHLVSILPNYESYRFEVQEEKVSADNGIFTFGSYFQEEETLQFVAIYEGEEILGMGFLR